MPYDEGAFINKNKQIIILCHVDDMAVTGPNNDEIHKLMQKVESEKIKVQYLGLLHTFLG